MKLSNDFILHSMGDETLLVPTGKADFHGLVQGNKTAEVILECLMQDTDEEKILSVLKERFDGDEADMREDIESVVTQLRSIGAIDD